MKKNRNILALTLTAALLTGCGNDNESSSGSSGTSSESTIQSTIISSGGSSRNDPESQDKPETSDIGSDESPSSSEDSVPQTIETPVSSEEDTDPDATFLVGLAGDTISRSELSMIFTNNGSEGSPETFSKDIFSGVLCDGFVYLAEPSGICRTNYDNEDVFDSEAMRFSDISESSQKNYKRVTEGETICGLTLTEAQVNFARGNDSTEYTLGDGSTKLGSELGFPEIYFMGGSASFSGQVTLTGYISIAAEDEPGLMAGDIIFVPSGCECLLPVMGYRFDPDMGIVHYQRINSHNGLVWENEYGSIFLGNAYETTTDLSGIPDDGSYVKASVTLDNIELVCGIGMMEKYTAEIADLMIL